MKLLKVEIHKYKSIETTQAFDVGDPVTVLVGMNEAGKTAVLEAIAKVNYFQDDQKFRFDVTHDFPRKEKKQLDKSGATPTAITLTFSIDEKLAAQITKTLGDDVFTTRVFKYSRQYGARGAYDGIVTSKAEFVRNLQKTAGFDAAATERLIVANTLTEFQSAVSAIDDEHIKAQCVKYSGYFENKWDWASDCISEYVARVFITPNMPKFLYYDEFYSLPSEIIIETLSKLDNAGASEEAKTARALFELADINTEELINADNFENFIAELEATQALISKELFRFWSANSNLKIRFAINKRIVEGHDGHGRKLDRIAEHVLNIRVENTRSDMTLPLKNRSKGFNWFFSFLVWFKKIQEDVASRYILLLDEPGLNLHATAQADLLRFFDELGKDYQIIYTTHSPFMIDASRLPTVRTVVETDTGTKISDSIQERDPKTLFPLQAALGYNIAQNLFISDSNLIVEGVSDLVILTAMSDTLKSLGRTSLKETVTIVPVGGLDKVTTFVSLMGANKLKMACLLDSFTDQKGKARLDDLVRDNIIKSNRIKFFDSYTTQSLADIEDLFTKGEYVAFFNQAFQGEYTVDAANLDAKVQQITQQIAKAIGKARFNHYRPARLIASGSASQSFQQSTLDGFEKVFADINKLF